MSHHHRVALTSWIRAFAIAAALPLGRNSFASAFKLVSCSFNSLAHNDVLTGTIVELVELETLSQLAFELLSQLRLSQYTIGIPYHSSHDLCSLIHL